MSHDWFRQCLVFGSQQYQRALGAALMPYVYLWSEVAGQCRWAVTPRFQNHGLGGYGAGA